jgi:hypothetical protein
MAGRRDDSTTGPDAVSGARRGERPSSSRSGTLRTVGPVVGLLLAVGATAAVFFTDDALYLRVALLAVCWAFLVAAFLAGNRRVDQVVAQAREAELRHAYEVELEREVTARREYELHLADELRRETGAGVRQELAELRGEIASLAGLRGDLAALAGLRAELAGLTQLRSDLGQLRGELSEQLSGELLIERMVMRAQSVRVPVDRIGDDPRVLDGRTADRDGWSATTWEEPRGGRSLPVPDARPPVTPQVPRSPVEWLADRSMVDPPETQREGSGDDEPVRLIAYPPKSPIEWLADRSLVDEDAPAPAPAPEPEPQRLRQVAPPPPAARQSRHRVGLDDEQTPAAPRRHRRAAGPDDRDDDLAGRAEPQDAGHARLAEILAESGAGTRIGGRRRRHGDEDDSADDVLARVLGRR